MVQFDQFESNLVIEQEKIIELLTGLGVDETKTVVIIGDLMDSSVARIAWTVLYFGHVKPSCLISMHLIYKNMVLN